MPTAIPLTRPHSPEAERTTISALLMDPDRIVDVFGTVEAADFYDRAYRTIYQAMSRLYEDRKPIDFVTVADALRADEHIQALGGAAFLATLAGEVPTSSHAAHHAAIIREK